MNKLIFFLTQFLMQWCERRGRVFKITGTAGSEDVYMIRYYVVKSRWFNFFIHQFLRSDRDDLHDHPWNFCTYLVRGAYTEQKYNDQTGTVERTRRENLVIPYSYSVKPGVPKDAVRIPEEFVERKTFLRKQNTFVFRKATDLHRVVVDQDLKESRKDEAALTLFFSGPHVREWGFVQAGKWIPWKKYLGLPEDTPGRG